MAESGGMGSQSDLGSHVNLRPTVSWLWQQDFTSIIQIPKQRQSALCQLQPAGPCLQGGTCRRGTRRGKRGERSRTEPQWMKTLRQDESQSHFDPSKHLADVIVVIRRTVRHIYTSVCWSLFNPQRGLFLMIMQMLSNGYRCHLHLVYSFDSLWHNFDRSGVKPQRSGRFSQKQLLHFNLQSDRRSTSPYLPLH